MSTSGTFYDSGERAVSGSERGRATSRDAALHFVRSRDTMADRFGALEKAGKITRFKGQSMALIWEAL